MTAAADYRSAGSESGASSDPAEMMVSRALVALAAFATLVDLFASQAIIPTLARSYDVSPGTMGVAVNACTIGMALASLLVGFQSRRIDRRTGIIASLTLLAVPTLLLAHAPNLTVFALLRVLQGLCMATAFTLSLTLLGERLSMGDAAAASAAYVTGNVVSNLVGRLLSASIADHVGQAWSFYVFAGLNVTGAVVAYLAFRTLGSTAAAHATRAKPSDGGSAADHRSVLSACGIGFLILLGFIGIFTYVNFVLMRDPFSLTQMQVGLIYLVFIPSVVTTPLAGRLVRAFGTRGVLIGGLVSSCAALPLLLCSSLPAVLLSLAIVASGTFLAQAVATGFVSRTMPFKRGTASGLYLASYFLGGVIGAALLGWLFEAYGWGACVAGVGVAFAMAALLALRLE